MSSAYYSKNFNHEDLGSSDEEIPLEEEPPSSESWTKERQRAGEPPPVSTVPETVSSVGFGNETPHGKGTKTIDVEMRTIHADSSPSSPVDETGGLLGQPKNPVGNMSVDKCTNKLRKNREYDDSDQICFSDDESDDAEYEGEELGHSHTGPTSTMFGASANYVNSIIGAGIIGLPFAIREAGLISGILLILFVGWIADYSTRLMVKVGIRFNRNTYEELCYFVFGRKGFLIVTLSMFVFAYGALVAYLIIIGDTIDRALSFWQDREESDSTRRVVISVVAFVPILPLSVVKNISRLSKSSGLSLVAVCWIILVVIIRAITGVGDAEAPASGEKKVSVIREKFFPAIGVISFAFVCHHSSFFVFRSLKNNTEKRWEKTTHYSVVIATIASLTLGVVSYSIFWDKTEANVLNNFSGDDNLVNVTRFAYALTMTLTYPLEIYVARQCIHSLLNPKKRHIGTREHYAVSISLWATSLAIALAVTDLGIVLELTGGLSATIIGFILPSALYLKTTTYRLVPWKNLPREQAAAWKNLLPSFLIFAVGIISLIASIVTVLNDFTHTHRSGGPG